MDQIIPPPASLNTRGTPNPAIYTQIFALVWGTEVHEQLNFGYKISPSQGELLENH